MAREWTPDLAVGVDEVDNQHKELFRNVNQLLVAMAQGTGKQQLGDILGFLANYAVSHFAMEEKHMTRYGYPSLESHRLQHVAFVRDFTQLKQRLESEGATTLLVLEVQKRVMDWLVNHITKTDKLMGAFLKSKMLAGANA